MRCVMYARYSSANQREISAEEQVRYCKEFIDAHGYVYVGSYVDKEMSGTNTRRKQFQNMLDDIVAHSDRERVNRMISWNSRKVILELKTKHDMIGSQLLLLVMNVWFLRGFASSMGQFIGNGGALSTGQGSIFLWMFCALAYLKCAQRFDSYGILQVTYRNGPMSAPKSSLVRKSQTSGRILIPVIPTRWLLHSFICWTVVLIFPGVISPASIFIWPRPPSFPGPDFVSIP